MLPREMYTVRFYHLSFNKIWPHNKCLKVNKQKKVKDTIKYGIFMYAKK